MNRKECLDAAAACVLTDRNQSYGSPEDSFSTIAGFWNVYLNTRADKLSSADVAALLALMKIARLARTAGAHADSWVDLAGYAACGAECGVKPLPGLSPYAIQQALPFEDPPQAKAAWAQALADISPNEGTCPGCGNNTNLNPNTGFCTICEGRGFTR